MPTHYPWFPNGYPKTLLANTMPMDAHCIILIRIANVMPRGTPIDTLIECIASSVPILGSLLCIGYMLVYQYNSVNMSYTESCMLMLSCKSNDINMLWDINIP